MRSKRAKEAIKIIAFWNFLREDKNAARDYAYWDTINELDTLRAVIEELEAKKKRKK